MIASFEEICILYFLYFSKNKCKQPSVIYIIRLLLSSLRERRCQPSPTLSSGKWDANARHIKIIFEGKVLERNLVLKLFFIIFF